jgi:hypothetical protein
MGKLIKNHWARLIILTAAIYQCAAALEGFFWPKIFWDFVTKNLDGAVKPFPILQIINLLFGLFGLAWEWPLKALAGTALHRSDEARLVVYPLSALAAALLYQATNPALYYCIGMGVYFWAFSEGEVSPTPPPKSLCVENQANCRCRPFVRNRGQCHELIRGVWVKFERSGALHPWGVICLGFRATCSDRRRTRHSFDR